MQKVTFEQWMSSVNARISEKMGGLISDDLPDCCYRDWYDTGVSARSAASKAIKMAKEG